MSTDFIEDVECEGAVVLLTMRSSGCAELTILESNDGMIAQFLLKPNQEGLANAAKIIFALQNWKEHITNLLLQEIIENTKDVQ